MATQWRPWGNAPQRSWLLADGSRLVSPAMEETSTGRRARITHTTESVYKGDVHGLVARWAHARAKRMKTRVLIETSRDWPAIVESGASIEFTNSPTARLHLVEGPTKYDGETICWWRFRHPETTQEAWVTVKVKGNTTNLLHTRATNLHVATMDHDFSSSTDTQMSKLGAQNLDLITDHTKWLRHGMSEEWAAWTRANPPSWPLDTLTNRLQTASPRHAVRDLLDVVRAWDEVDRLQMPDLRRPGTPSYTEFLLAETNVNGRFIADLREYLDGTATVQLALEQMEAFYTTLRALGVDVRSDQHDDNNLAAAMLGGDDHLVVRVRNPLADDPLESDPLHNVSIHLPSGSILVTCQHKIQVQGNTDEIKQRWDEAKLLARLTGEEDELLAYARKYAAHQAERRIKNAMKTRS